MNKACSVSRKPRKPYTNTKLDQEELISLLSTHDASSTLLYTRILLVLPLTPILLYLTHLFDIRNFTPSLAAIVSLLASAYTLYYLPLPPINLSSQSTRGSSGRNFVVPPETQRVPYLSSDTAEIVRKYIITANSSLCVILALWELMQRRSWSEGMMIGGGYIPGFVFAVILWARQELRVMDLGELERLRYRTKGG